MNYGVIPFAIANNKEECQDYRVRFNEIGIATDRIIIVNKLENITGQLKEGDALVILADVKYCKQTKAVLNMLEMVLAKGVTVCLYNKKVYVIQPDELPLLQMLIRRLMHQEQIINPAVN